MKAAGHGLMSLNQYLATAQQLDRLSPCNFLVFGLGHDAYVWDEINAGGRTVFLEDDEEWISNFEDSGLEVYPVNYNTKAADYEKIGFDESKLRMDLPKDITDVSWDMIFVDGPLGHNPPRPYKGPGRMKSIYAAYNLLKNNGICIMDDMGRLIESKYAYHFFGKENLLFGRLVENKIGIFTKNK
tara:strand:- start:156 stop:710 length:555 start_codon:yes stop_codon:yes gene_type:complete